MSIKNSLCVVFYGVEPVSVGSKSETIKNLLPLSCIASVLFRIEIEVSKSLIRQVVRRLKPSKLSIINLICVLGEVIVLELGKLTVTVYELMIYYTVGLNVRKCVVKYIVETLGNNVSVLIILSEKRFSPNLIVDSVILGKHLVFFKKLYIIVRKYHIEGRTALYDFERLVLDISRHIGGRACDFYIPVEYHSEERNRSTGREEAAGIKRSVKNYGSVRYRISVTRIYHNLTVLVFELRKKLGRMQLSVLTVIRIVLIEVRVKIRA